jgi:hypothetical protein
MIPPKTSAITFGCRNFFKPNASKFAVHMMIPIESKMKGSVPGLEYRRIVLVQSLDFRGSRTRTRAGEGPRTNLDNPCSNRVVWVKLRWILSGKTLEESYGLAFSALEAVAHTSNGSAH